jgi:hypothetical protein
MSKFFDDPAKTPSLTVIDAYISEREGGNAPRGN